VASAGKGKGGSTSSVGASSCLTNMRHSYIRVQKPELVGASVCARMQRTGLA